VIVSAVDDYDCLRIGHKNPDTDTVCSAIAYEHFLNAQNVDAKAFAREPVNNGMVTRVVVSCK